MNKRKITPYPLYNSDNPLLQNPANDLKIFEGKPFWCNQSGFNENSAQCCFNHIIGLPSKNNNEYAIFDYELDVISKIK